jgi:RNase adaptor protein for sRNA GlmZ degradation
MKLVLVTGMSGAGKSVALNTLEDAGFEAIDNLPLALLSTVVASGKTSRGYTQPRFFHSAFHGSHHTAKTAGQYRV